MDTQTITLNHTLPRKGKVDHWSYASEQVEIKRLISTYNIKSSFYGVAWSTDGRKFEVGHHAGRAGVSPWSIMHEIKNFYPHLKRGSEGKLELDLKRVLREFIITQYRDGDEISPEYVKEDLFYAESRYPISGRRKWETFSSLFSESFEQVKGIMEEALIELFCETEGQGRFLEEENGIYRWRRA